MDWLQAQLQGAGIGGVYAGLVAGLVLIAGVALVAWIADIAAKRLLLRAVHFLVARTRAEWDDRLMGAGVFSRAAHMAPALVVYLSGGAFGPAQAWIERLALMAVIAVALRALDALLDALVDIYQTTEVSREKPILGYVQIAKIVLWVIGGIFILATLLQKDPWGLLTGLGAMSAIGLLVFRDSILSFVAGIQIALNKMVQRGDWIEMPSHGIDGDVVGISLHTVKVQNFDKTISTIPVQHLVSESFKNWRGMEESGGRRIKRSILIDVDSIRFCDDEMLARFSKIRHVADYVERKRSELDDWNESHASDPSPRVNSRRLTNIGTFRAYVEAYLRHHPRIRQDMTFLIRQLAPTREGLPIEIYVFSGEQDWVRYEAVQADIFDHLLAVVREFDLRLAQEPGADDLIEAARVLAGSRGAD